MKRPMFFALCLLALISLSVACGGSSSTPIATASPSPTVSGTTAPPTSTPPPGPLSLIWTAPGKEIVVPTSQEVFINVRGEGTTDSSAIITVAIDNDQSYGNGVLEQFARTYPGGPFLVTISSLDFPPGTYYFVAKIMRGVESIIRYLDVPVTLVNDSTITLTTPAVDIIAGWNSNFAFLGVNNSGSANIFVGLDQDRNPTNGYASLLDTRPIGANFNMAWNVDQRFNGRYFPFVHVREAGIDVFYYANGSLLIGQLPSITFTSPLNRVDIHPKPPVTLNIKGSSTSVGTTGVMRIGYDTDTNPNNGGITWLFNDLSVGPFEFNWDTQFPPGGPYYIVGEVVDEFGRGTNYATAPIYVDPSSYLEFYEPLTDIVITAGQFYPFPVFVRGFAYSTAGTGLVTVFTATNPSDATTYKNLGSPFAEGYIDGIRIDVSLLDPGIFYVGARLQYGVNSITRWAPMTISVVPNPDRSNPANFGAYYSDTESFAMQDPDRSNKNVRWRIYYPVSVFGSAEIADARFPVVFFIPEQNTLNTSYTYLTRRIAQWGYIVVALDSTTNTGGTYEMLRAQNDGFDCSFILDWLIEQDASVGARYFGKIDTSKVAVGGHGRGGGAAVIMSRDDDRVTAIFGLAPTRYTETTTPFPVILPLKPLLFFAGTRDNYDTVTTIQNVYNSSSPFKEMVTLQGGNHIQFLDSPTGWDGTATISHEMQMQITQVMTVAYLNWILGINADHKSWVNGSNANAIPNITIQYAE